MNSKKIYNFYNQKFKYTKWLNDANDITENEGEVNWQYCGVKDDYKKEFVLEQINMHFPDDEELYACITANKSALLPKTLVAEEIGKYIHKTEIGVLDKALTKMIHFTTTGVFAKGLIVEYPKSREREKGTPLKVMSSANMSDYKTDRIPKLLRDAFEKISERLHKDYGGIMEQLWIDVELLDHHVKERGTFNFRFQKRVGGSNPFMPSAPVCYDYNVGHFSFAPDFEKIQYLEESEILPYFLELLYDSSEILLKKQKSLGSFDAVTFRSDLLDICRELGMQK